MGIGELGVVIRTTIGVTALRRSTGYSWGKEWYASRAMARVSSSSITVFRVLQMVDRGHVQTPSQTWSCEREIPVKSVMYAFFL